METSPKLVKHGPNRPSDRTCGASSPTLLVALLFLLVAIGGVVGWMLFGSTAPPAPPPEVPDAKSEPPDPAPAEVQGAAPVVEKEPQAQRDPAWQKGVDGLERIPVHDGKTKKMKYVDTYPLKGEVVDADSNEPVYFFWIYLIPPERGDVVEASKGATPSRFRNGQFALERQPAGVYNVLCESREHDRWTGQIKIPYDGSLRIRLKHGTAITGTVTDSSQTPLEGIEMQLVVDTARLDGGADPPMQRLCKTDKMGRYSFNRIPTGVYGLKATLMGDDLASEPDFRVDPGATVIRDVALQRMGALKVTVKNIADQAVTRARVTLVADRDGRERTVRMGYTDLRGVTRLDFVRDGTYKLRVVLQGFDTWEQEVGVSSGDASREVPVQLEVAQKTGR
ncbi:MAG TPA: carboxypeptidase-like regulatory domain-containing protein [Planctomycetota bacterium]|nr:carboxypeptidase-like regulatory domain-containing protein [Planctomycetota bacterium]